VPDGSGKYTARIDQKRVTLIPSTCVTSRLTDVDTFITNPAIAIQDLLPLSSLTPKSLILGNQDHNGFNAGVMLFHVERLLVKFTEEVLQLEKQYTIPWWFAPTDQHLICDALKEDPTISDRFYEIPQAWLNIYYLPNNIADADNKEEEEPHLQVHPVRGVKKKLSHRKLLEAADEVYKLGKEKAMQIGDRGNGLETLGQRSKTKRFAERWWQEHPRGSGGYQIQRLLNV
jgi:hypothetical protein